MDSISNSNSCTNFNLCSFRGCAGDPRVAVEPEPPTTSTNTSCGVPAVSKKLDALAGWLAHSVAAAFFASLQGCGCIHIDSDEDINHEDFITIPLRSNRGCQEDISIMEIPIAN